MAKGKLFRRRDQLSDTKRALLEKRLQRALDGSGIREVIPRHQWEGRVPLSFAQERMWFLYQYAPESPAYNRSLALRLSGALDQATLLEALNEIVRRHEVLRVVYGGLDEGPHGRILPVEIAELSVVDLSVYPGEERQARARQLAALEVQRLFNLEVGPMVRARLMRLGELDHVLLLVMHHIAFDAWSAGVLMQELSALYAAYSKGEEPPLPELPIQYADYAAWQRDRFSGDLLERELSYWRETMAETPPPLELPLDRPRPKKQTYNGACSTFSIPAPLVDSMRKLADQEDATMFMVLLGAFQTLLYRYTGQQDVLVGVPVAGRNQEQTERLIGLFINTLVMRANLAGAPTFREVLGQVRRFVLGALENQELPFEKLVEDLKLERDISRTPLFQVMINFRNLPERTLQDGELQVELFEFDTRISHFDLTLDITPRGGGLRCLLIYNTDLYNSDTIERMGGHYLTMLEGIAADPDQPVGRLPLLTARERQQALTEWNNSQVSYPPGKCIHQLFEEQVLKTPEKVAVVCEGQELTYRQLNARANHLAYVLHRLELRRGDVVAIHIDRSLEMVVSLLAVLKAGGAYLPLDPSLPRERLGFMLNDSRARVILTRTTMLEKLPENDAIVVRIDEEMPVQTDRSVEDLSIDINPHQAAYIIYTSGSTGVPKGVLVSHYNVARLFQATQDWFNFNSEDVWSLFHTYAFDVSVWEIWGALLYGGRLVVVPYWSSRDPHEFYRLLVDHGVTVLSQTPSAFFQLLQIEEFLDPQYTPDLRLVIFAGEALNVISLKSWFERRGDTKPQLVNMYGITETTVHATYYPLTKEDLESKKSVVGVPIPDLQIYILDHQMELLPIGVPGEIYVGGAGVALGYLDRPELTAQRFVPDPFSRPSQSSATLGGARLYRSGDIARYLPNGELEFLGRSDFQVKIRGFRVELGEVESVLGGHPAVQSAVVMEREGRHGDKQLVAYLVLATQAELTVKELRNYLNTRLPEYMIPASYVILQEMPLTPNGKLDRRALPIPDDTSQDRVVDTMPPRDELETELVKMWEAVLGVSPVGVLDDFFELGGHSLLAVRLVSQIEEWLGKVLPLSEFFQVATVAQQAELLRHQMDAPQRTPIPRKETGEPAPLSFAQQRLWFLYQMGAGRETYNLPFVFRIRGRLNLDALQASLNDVVARHEILRTRFENIDDEPRQVIDRRKALDISITDLRSTPQEQLEEEIEGRLIEAGREVFDLAGGLLLRVNLYRLADAEYVLQFNIHHAIFDEWSSEVFFRELSEHYTALINDRLVQLAELPIQYADFSIWQRDRMDEDVLNEQLAYWKGKLAGASGVLELPADYPRSEEPSFKGASVYRQFSSRLLEDLRRLAHRERVTLFSTTLSAFQILLYSYTAQVDFIVGSPIANRNNIELHNLVGLFLNMLVLRADLSGNPSFRELLKRTGETVLGAFDNQDLPFEVLVEEIKPSRQLNRHPLFQVVYVFHSASSTNLELLGLQINRLRLDYGWSRFDLTLFLSETQNGLEARVEYSTDLFDRGSIERLLDHLEMVLENIVANPEITLGNLSLLTESEQTRLLGEWNSPRVDYPSQKCIHHLFEEQVEKTPEKIAIVCGDQRLSYKQLNDRSNQLAHYLVKRGVGPEKVVGLCIERSVEMVIGVLGILKAGGAYLPMEPDIPNERLVFMLEDVGAEILLTQDHLQDRLGDQHVQKVCLDAGGADFSDESQDNPKSEVVPGNLSYIIYTSGSTGLPKGVMIPHRNVVSLLYACETVIRSKVNVVGTSISSLAFDTSVWEMFSNLCFGGALHILTFEMILDSARFADYLITHQVTRTFVHPGLLQDLVKQLERRVGQQGLSSLEFLMTGLEPKKEGLLQLVSSLSKDIQIVNAYGSTEITVMATHYDFESADKPERDAPIGVPFPNCEIYIVDRFIQPVPVGFRGEILIGGENLARGYINQPGFTAERFIPNPFSDQPGAVLYRSGDMGRFRPDGNIEFLGRLDHQVKVRGYRVELGEVESILGEHPGVERAVVIASDEPSAGSQGVAERDVKLVALVSHGDGQVLDVKALRDFLGTRIPGYMIPSEFVVMDVMPLLPSGKIDRDALPRTGQSRPELGEDYVPPRTSAERALVEVWSEVLGIREIGIFDNFFALGGDSILSLKMIAMAKKAGLVMTVKQVFEHQTVAELAVAADVMPSLQVHQGLVGGSFPLTPIQGWFFEQDLAQPHHHNQYVLLESAFALNPEWMEEAIRHLLIHHDALRSRFSTVNSGWQAEIVPPDDQIPFIRIDLSSLEPDSRESGLSAAMKELQTSLDLSHGPLIRVALFDRGSGAPHQLCLIIHHLVVDVVSWQILLEDLTAAYQQIGRGERVRLMPKTTSYIDWACLLVDHADKEPFLSERDYWSTLSGLDVHPLPVDHPLEDDGNTVIHADVVSVSLTGEETGSLLQDVPKAYQTQINDVLLTALVLSFKKLNGVPAVLMDLEGHGREETLTGTDISRTVGWFTSIFPVYLDLGGVNDIGDALKSVKEQLRHIPNRGAGFGVLRYLSGDRELRKVLKEIPRSQVSFNYMGRLDRMLSGGSLFDTAVGGIRFDRSPLGARLHLLSINAYILGKQLRLDWQYNVKIHNLSTVTRLANDYLTSLKEIIEHCLSSDAGGYTPSDFPEADLSQDELDDLIASLNG